jgi:hypothetical protein
MINKNMYASRSAIDDALWAAYRCNDKAAVMDYLFRRRLGGIGCPRSFPRLAINDNSKKDRTARRARGGVDQIPLQSTLN